MTQWHDNLRAHPALDRINLAALSSRYTLRMSYHIACRAIQDAIPGDFVECGVFAGSQAAAMALAIQNHTWIAPTRRVHLLDTFAGIPEPGPRDIEFLEANHHQGLSKAPLDGVMVNMKAWGVDESLLVYHQGLFQDSLDVAIAGAGVIAPITQIAVLRLDGDLYESTKVCMEKLYPLLSPGGWLIVDDYNLSGCRQAVDEVLMGKGSTGYGPAYFQRQP